ncbi:MAG: PEGA domain-containing protein [Planctomycetota bacterium]|nr:PEGA domain-containing protein [Planctomycetota bacterium]
MLGCRIFVLSLTALATVLCAGCVRRTIAITSTPSDALVFVNDREIGRTPCEVDFLFYGEYDVRLKHEGYESIVGSGTASAPFWDFIGADLLVEVAPVNLESRVEWHFDFIPANDNHVDLLARARQMQDSARGEPLEVDGVPSIENRRATVQKAIFAPVRNEQGAIPPKGSSAVPVPPTESPADVPGAVGKPAPNP